MKFKKGEPVMLVDYPDIKGAYIVGIEEDGLPSCLIRMNWSYTAKYFDINYFFTKEDVKSTVTAVFMKDKVRPLNKLEKALK